MQNFAGQSKARYKTSVGCRFFNLLNSLRARVLTHFWFLDLIGDNLKALQAWNCLKVVISVNLVSNTPNKCWMLIACNNVLTDNYLLRRQCKLNFKLKQTYLDKSRDKWTNLRHLVVFRGQKLLYSNFKLAIFSPLVYKQAHKHNEIPNYHHFVGHCGAFYGLKWRIWRAKMYFSPLK